MFFIKRSLYHSHKFHNYTLAGFWLHTPGFSSRNTAAPRQRDPGVKVWSAASVKAQILNLLHLYPVTGC